MAKTARDSTFYRSRDSAAIVTEARGVPFQWISLLLAVVYTVIGIRDVFFCDVLLTGSPAEVEMMAVYGGENCKSMPLNQCVMGLVGVCNLMQAMIRYMAATTSHVAELYYAMALLVFSDAGFLFNMTRAQGLGEYPILYIGAVGGSLLYELSILYIARKAFVARSKMTKIYTSLPPQKSD